MRLIKVCLICFLVVGCNSTLKIEKKSSLDPNISKIEESSIYTESVTSVQVKKGPWSNGSSNEVLSFEKKIDVKELTPTQLKLLKGITELKVNNGKCGEDTPVLEIIVYTGEKILASYLDDVEMGCRLGNHIKYVERIKLLEFIESLEK